ncbi:MAG: putative ABC transporter permease [Lachnospiraceae bacterium]|jgi:uncharacterized membrane protein|nr:putative ABC transporter permease [Lachnospiraceae bacterium]MCR4778410.1 putative ABC transporter permease [Lachnospiraceae bacterium]
MWERTILGTDIYHLIACFHIYSMLGWLVESIYMSFCEKRLVNRGFGKGPFCPIYGFGAVIGNMVLSPLASNYIALYLVGAVLATTFEFLVAMLMKKLLGSFWWDYNEKPFNYKGMICLESTVAWGFYAIIVVGFLNDAIISFVDRFDRAIGVYVLVIILAAYTFDFIVAFAKAKGVTTEDIKRMIVHKRA